MIWISKSTPPVGARWTERTETEEGMFTTYAPILIEQTKYKGPVITGFYDQERSLFFSDGGTPVDAHRWTALPPQAALAGEQSLMADMIDNMNRKNSGGYYDTEIALLWKCFDLLGRNVVAWDDLQITAVEENEKVPTWFWRTAAGCLVVMAAAAACTLLP